MLGSRFCTDYFEAPAMVEVPSTPLQQIRTSRRSLDPPSPPSKLRRRRPANLFTFTPPSDPFVFTPPSLSPSRRDPSSPFYGNQLEYFERYGYPVISGPFGLDPDPLLAKVSSPFPRPLAVNAAEMVRFPCVDKYHYSNFTSFMQFRLKRCGRSERVKKSTSLSSKTSKHLLHEPKSG